MLLKKLVGFFLVFGFIGAILRLTQFGGVVLGVPVAVAVLLLFTQPVWTILLSKAFLKEKISKSKILAVLLVLAGVVVLVNPFSTSSFGSTVGIIVSLIGGFFLACWVVFGRKVGLAKIPAITTTFGYVLFMLFFLFLFYPVISFFVKDPSIIRFSLSQPALIWIYLLAFMLFAGIIPYTLLFKGEHKIQASHAGIILLLEPIGAALLATIFLKQPLTINILAGGALILASNYITAVKK